MLNVFESRTLIESVESHLIEAAKELQREDLAEGVDVVEILNRIESAKRVTTGWKMVLDDLCKETDYMSRLVG